MAKKRVLDFNPITGETVFFEYNDHESKVTLTHEQDVTPIINKNKRIAGKQDWRKAARKDDLVKYASVPNTIIIKWKQELGVDLFNPDHRKKVFKLLNSPEYSYLKVTDMYADS